MGYYKVPQDVESEDKLIANFTFKQFIFVLLTLGGAYLVIQLTIAANFFVGAIFLPPTLIFAIFGFWHPKDQPVESKFYAYVNYFFKPHTRVWSRDGIVEHVIIQAPKMVEKYYSDNRSPEEVRSQLKRLAQVVDTRGWSTKEAALQLPTNVTNNPNDDRIINPALTAPKEAIEIHDAEDIFDVNANATAQNIEQLTNQAATRSRAEALEHMRKIVQPSGDPEETNPRKNDKTPKIERFHSQKPKLAIHENEKVVEPLNSQKDNPSEKDSDTEPPQSKPNYRPYPNMHQHVIDPYGDSEAQQEQEPKAQEEKYEVPEEIRRLAQSEMSVSSIQRRAQEAQNKSEGELNIQHNG